MKTFNCAHCQARVFFENTHCESCSSKLGFLPSKLGFVSFSTDEQGAVVDATGLAAEAVVQCANHALPASCNWLVEDGQTFCLSCRTTQILPDLGKLENARHWAQIEAAKRRLVFSLVSWGLPFPNKQEDPPHGVAFHFLEELSPQEKVLTGHDDGVITLNVAEADDSVREKVREQMHEPYRTLLGHLRHEVGHYYWDRLISDTQWADEFRNLFGDERADYAEALKQHYAAPVPDWQARFVSSYASSHPWEDWAECWAHYMHLRDALETAASWQLHLGHAVPGEPAVAAACLPDDAVSIRQSVVETWLPVSQFINAMSRSLGSHDSYPFVVPDPVLDKLDFIHKVVQAGVRGDSAMNFSSEQVQAPLAQAA